MSNTKLVFLTPEEWEVLEKVLGKGEEGGCAGRLLLVPPALASKLEQVTGITVTEQITDYAFDGDPEYTVDIVPDVHNGLDDVSTVADLRAAVESSELDARVESLLTHYGIKPSWSKQ